MDWPRVIFKDPVGLTGTVKCLEIEISSEVNQGTSTVRVCIIIMQTTMLYACAVLFYCCIKNDIL